MEPYPAGCENLLPRERFGISRSLCGGIWESLRCQSRRACVLPPWRRSSSPYCPLSWLCTVLLWLVAAPSWAQSTATLQGTVTDTQGAIVPGASVTATNEATGVQRTVTTDSAGHYQMAALPVGSYRLDARLAGFQPKVVNAIRLEVAQTVVLNVQLGLSGVSEEIAVTAEAPVIESATTSVGQVINQRTVQEIPLNGRHFVDLGLLIPGSVAPSQTGFLTAPLRGQGSFAFNTAGNREDTVNFMVNGVNLNDQVQNQITFQPSINTVSEFKVDNQTLSAEYGRSSGAVVNIATRSGTNSFHGELFEFYRNQDLDARNFFNVASQPQSPFKRNQFGANLGGPLAKNKAFFFVTYEGLRQRQQLDFNSGVLSDAQRAAVQPAPPDPGRERHQRHRSPALHRHGRREREHRPVDGRRESPALGQRHPARLLRVPEGPPG
ncbi:MAG: hypothetical protein DMF77_04225 [Acidobacteria bacterium]|nr:MAG: hypothetical protein DMF77_04225 [Acidobacteriota bacterium]